ncbi:MAG: multicopper oxidase domain-containing protein [Candidatus Nanopelagicales bacterium]
MRAWTLLAALPLALAGCATSGAGVDIHPVEFATPLPIPPLQQGRGDSAHRRYTLTAEAGTHRFGPGLVSPTIGFDGDYLGPTLLMRRGDRVRVDVTNDLDEATTVHWHGLHVPARMDGGPHQMVAPGGKWHPRWTVDQPAATLWYHPHPHGQTAQQVYRGLAGLLLIADPAHTPAALPHRYGVDDVPLVVQDKTFTDGGELVVDPVGKVSTGFLGDTIVVNGAAGPVRDVTTEAVRLRLLNASNSRFYDFAFDDSRPFAVVASDGGLLAEPVATDHVQLSPGERAEIVVRFRPGESITLSSRHPDFGHGIEASDRFGGGGFPIVRFQAAPTLAPSPVLPRHLADVPAPDEASARGERRFAIMGRAINGRPMDLGRIDEVVPLGQAEVWTITNEDPQPHNFHVHDGSFRVLSVDGAPPAAVQAGYKDTVYVPPRATVKILVRFTDYADPRMPYMFHCHLLLHEDLGVMGQFVVVRPGQKVVPPSRPEATGEAPEGSVMIHGGNDPTMNHDPVRR